MASDQLSLIRQFCDTSKYRLSNDEKNLLCMILENPDRYNGFTSNLHSESDSGKDYKGRWSTCTKWQYRIYINSVLSIDERYYHYCDDGFEDKRHWEWEDAWHITDTRRILEILKEIRSEL